MEIYSTEEQQAEAIKRFFRENGTALVIGVVLGLGGLYGWKAYNQNQVESAEAASDAYEKLVKADAQNKTNVLAGADEFIKNNNLNQQLNSETKIAGIASTSLPKFFFTAGWYPSSVINFSSSYKGLKTSIFCQGVDLIVHYGCSKPASEKHYDIL